MLSFEENHWGGKEKKRIFKKKMNIATLLETSCKKIFNNIQKPIADSVIEDLDNYISLKAEHEQLLNILQTTDDPIIELEYEFDNIPNKRQKRNEESTNETDSDAKSTQIVSWNDIFESAHKIQIAETALKKLYLNRLMAAYTIDKSAQYMLENLNNRVVDLVDLTSNDDINIASRSLYMFMTGKNNAKQFINDYLTQWQKSDYDKSKCGVQFFVQYNRWYNEMVRSFDSTLQRSINCPPSALFENYLYKQHNHRLYDDDLGTPVTLRSFATDLPYLFSKFCGLFGTLPFFTNDTHRLIKEMHYSMKKALYTDTYFFYHFVAYIDDEIDYDDFLNNEAAYVITSDDDSKFNIFCNAIKRVATLVCKHTPNEMFFPHKKKDGFLQIDDWTLIPDTIMEHIAPFIIDNISDEIYRFRKTGSEDRLDYLHNMNINRDSSIGRYLNFGETAFLSIKKLIRTLSRQNGEPEDNIHLRSYRIELRKLECIRDVYMMIVLSSVIVNLIDEPHVFVTTTAIQIADHKIPMYISSTEAFPGVVVYALIKLIHPLPSSINEDFNLNIFTKNDFYERPTQDQLKKLLDARKNFLVAFTIFSQSLDQLSISKHYPYMPGLAKSKLPEDTNISQAFAPVLLDNNSATNAIRGLRQLNSDDLFNKRMMIQKYSTSVVAAVISLMLLNTSININDTEDVGLNYMFTWHAEKATPLSGETNLYESYRKDIRFFLLTPLIPYISAINVNLSKDKKPTRAPTISTDSTFKTTANALLQTMTKLLSDVASNDQSEAEEEP